MILSCPKNNVTPDIYILLLQIRKVIITLFFTEQIIVDLINGTTLICSNNLGAFCTGNNLLSMESVMETHESSIILESQNTAT